MIRRVLRALAILIVGQPAKPRSDDDWSRCRCDYCGDDYDDRELEAVDRDPDEGDR